MKTVAQTANSERRELSGRRALRRKLPAASFRHLQRSLKKQFRRYRKELQRCQKKFSEKSVHESRVAARRLLSTVELLGGFLSGGRVRKVQRFLKRHLDTFDDLRDTQVQLVSVANLQRAFPAARSFHAWLLKRQERFIKQTRNCVKRIQPKPLAKQLAACQ